MTRRRGGDLMAARVEARATALAATFAAIEATRMQGLPLLNPSLRVQAVGFAVERDDDASLAVGVLVTPWFINLVRLPLERDAEDTLAAVGERRERKVGTLEADFIGAHEAALGRFEACSLFSPVFEFADQAAAVATAEAVLALLREPAGASAAQPARRAFLFGRRASAAA